MNMKTHNNAHSAQFYTPKSESRKRKSTRLKEQRAAKQEQGYGEKEETQEHSFIRAASSEAVTKIQGKMRKQGGGG